MLNMEPNHRNGFKVLVFFVTMFGPEPKSQGLRLFFFLLPKENTQILAPKHKGYIEEPRHHTFVALQTTCHLLSFLHTNADSYLQWNLVLFAWTRCGLTLWECAQRWTPPLCTNSLLNEHQRALLDFIIFLKSHSGRECEGKSHK